MQKIKKKIARLLHNKSWLKIISGITKRRGIYFYWGLLFVLLIFIGTYLFPRGKAAKYAEYQIGTVAPERIISPVKFDINKTSDDYEQEKENARQSVLARFYRDYEAERESENNMSDFFNKITEFRKINTTLNELNLRLNREEPDTALIKQIESVESQIDFIDNQFKRESNIDILSSDFLLLQMFSDEEIVELQNNCTRVLKDVSSIGKLNILKNQSPFIDIDLLIREGSSEIVRNINSYIDQNDSYSEISGRLEYYYAASGDTVDVGNDIIQSFLIPNIKYDAELTESLRAEEAAKVARSRGFVEQDEKIIDRYERVTQETYLKIQSLREYLTKEGVVLGRFSTILIYFGQAGFLAFLVLLFGIYLYIFRRNIIKNSVDVTIIFLIFLSQIFFVYLVSQQFELSGYLIPVTIASMLLAILYDGGVGIYGTVIISFMVGGYLSNDFNLTLYSLAGGAASVIAVRRIRHLSQFFKAIIYIFLTYALVLFITNVIRGMTLGDISWIMFRYTLPNSLLSPLITLGFLAFFEVIFGKSTNMTLLELSDLNRPLLRELSMTAPGTYHHSIILGNLAERAAEAIGANSLLARVGCYYHDIGKMVKPQYFIENEPDAGEKHDSLAPSMSSLIISAHVREGLEYAEKHRLPQSVKDFILQHHGTSKISFFYEKALQKSKDKNINPSDYCYPGPKPQTKETGIAMLAD
ncbi:HD family phosphohydrolase, partial [candidate division KSB1 bacterium]